MTFVPPELVAADWNTGAVVSMARIWVAAVLVLPAVSVTVTLMLLLPLALIASVPLSGVAEPVSNVQFLLPSAVTL
jgi:hypothetical protein